MKSIAANRQKASFTKSAIKKAFSCSVIHVVIFDESVIRYVNIRFQTPCCWPLCNHRYWFSPVMCAEIYFAVFEFLLWRMVSCGCSDKPYFVELLTHFTGNWVCTLINGFSIALLVFGIAEFYALLSGNFAIFFFALPRCYLYLGFRARRPEQKKCLSFQTPQSSLYCTAKRKKSEIPSMFTCHVV